MDNYIIALVAGLLGMFGWGLADFFAKKTVDKIGELKTLLSAQIIGGVFLFLYFIFSKSTFPALSLGMISGVFTLAMLDCTGYLFLYRAFRKGVMSIVSPIASSAAGFSVVISVVLFKENISKWGLIGIVLIFLGIIIISTDFTDLRKSFSRSNFTNGIPEAFAVIIFLGLWFPLWDRFVGDKDWIFWLMILKLMMGFILFVYSYFTSYAVGLFSGYKPTFKILIVIAILELLAYLGVTWGYSVTANTTSLITVISNAYSLPVIFLAYIFLKDRMSKQQILGVLSIIGGIAISS